MKQLAILMVAGFMALSLTACGGDDQRKQPEVTNETTPQATQMPAQDVNQSTPNQANESVESDGQGSADNQVQE